MKRNAGRKSVGFYIRKKICKIESVYDIKSAGEKYTKYQKEVKYKKLSKTETWLNKAKCQWEGESEETQMDQTYHSQTIGSIKRTYSVCLCALLVMIFSLTPSFSGMVLAETESISNESEAALEEAADDSLANWPQGPSVMAESGIVMEVSTGTILYEKNIDEQHYPASITKIMTVLLAIENCEMDEMVTVPHEAVYMEDKGSHIALDEGEELTVEHCLYGIMLASANDAAYALAIHIGGTIENFADMMNARAQELGCRNTHFVNPNGLPNEEHLTTAYDMALITKQALSYDIFRTVSATTYYEIPPSENQKDLIPMSNHHKMLCSGKYHYEGAFSGKVGYTVVAQNTLVTCASRDGMELICVTMKTQGKQVYVDTASLLDFGFENFRKLNISENESGYSQVDLDTIAVPVKAQKDSAGFVVIPKQASFSQLEPWLDCQGAGPDNPLGTLFYTYEGHQVGSTKLMLDIPKAVAEETKNNGNNTGVLPEGSNDGQKKSEKLWTVPICIVVGMGAGVFAYQYIKICRERRRRGICRNRRSRTEE